MSGQPAELRVNALSPMNEAVYQSMLMEFLHQRLAPHRTWPVRGRGVSYLGRLLFPDLELESDVSGKLRTIAIVELKLNRRFGFIQPMLYAFAKDVPAYCAVDGFRRTPIHWRFNMRSSQLRSLEPALLDAKLLGIKRAIEDFNYETFL